MTQKNENIQRQQKILLLLALDETLTIAALVKRFQLPVKVIQQDLLTLEQQGLLTRV